MKKLLALLFISMAAFTFAPTQIFAAEGDTPTEEVLTLEEEEALFQAELNAILTQVFAYVGGFAGLSALLAFAFKFIRDRGIMNKLKTQIEDILSGNVDVATAMNALVETVKGYTERGAVLEKSVIHLITISNLDSALKEQVINGLNNDTISVQDVLDAGLVQIQQEVADRVNVQTQVNEAATSLLEQLSKDEA
jgi:hypothetical protein